MPRPYGRIATWLALGAVGAVGVVAGVDAIRGSEEGKAPPAAPREALTGPGVPAPGALPGALVLADPDRCRLRVLDLADLGLSRPGPATLCRLWAAPVTGLVVALRPGAGDRRELWLVRAGDPPALERVLGPAVSAPSWSPDARLVAWCEPGGRTVVAALLGGSARRLRGCYPAFAPDGSVVTRRTVAGLPEILRDGRAVLDEDDVARAFPAEGAGRGPTYAVGHTVTSERVLVLAVLRSGDGFRYRTGLELWRGAALVGALPIRSYGPATGFFGLRLEVGPDGEIAVVSPDQVALLRPDDLVTLVDLHTGRAAEELEQYPFGGIAWSPDGRWLALSTGAEILVFGRGSTEPAYALPLPARALAWVTTP